MEGCNFGPRHLKACVTQAVLFHLALITPALTQHVKTNIAATSTLMVMWDL